MLTLEYLTAGVKVTLGSMIDKKGWGEPPGRQELDSLHGLQQDQPYNMTPVSSAPEPQRMKWPLVVMGLWKFVSAAVGNSDTHLLPDSACDTQVGLVWQEP